MVELVARYWAFAQTFYVKDGEPGGEIPPLKQALRFLRRLHGRTPAAEFSPLKLEAVRAATVTHLMTQSPRVRDRLRGQ